MSRTLPNVTQRLVSGKERWDKPKRTAESRLCPEETAWGVYDVSKCPRRNLLQLVGTDTDF